jgi:hypothetical protein
MIKPKKPPYNDTKKDPESTILDINRMLRLYGVDNYQWTTPDGREAVRPGGHHDREGAPRGPERAARDLRPRGPSDDDAIHRLGAGDRGGHDVGDARLGESGRTHRDPRGEGAWTEWDNSPQAPDDTADVISGFVAWHQDLKLTPLNRRDDPRAGGDMHQAEGSADS